MFLFSILPQGQTTWITWENWPSSLNSKHLEQVVMQIMHKRRMTMLFQNLLMGRLLKLLQKKTVLLRVLLKGCFMPFYTSRIASDNVFMILIILNLIIIQLVIFMMRNGTFCVCSMPAILFNLPKILFQSAVYTKLRSRLLCRDFCGTFLIGCYCMTS